MPLPSLQPDTRGLTRPFESGEQVATRVPAAGGGVWFALLMFAMSHAWLLVVRDPQASASALASYAQQQAIVWVAFLLVDLRLKRRWAQFTWASIGMLYATCTVLDGLLMRMTSLPLREILPMLLASHHVVEGLREIGLKPIRVVVLTLLLLLAAVAGGGIRLLLGRFARARADADADADADRRPAPRKVWVVAAWWSLLPVSFVAEQTLARDQDDYLYRAFRMPAYLQLYGTSSRSVELTIPEPVPHEQRKQWLKDISEAKNPRHVLYVLLESFRADAVHPRVSPTIAELARTSMQYDHALAEATYTPLSWSVLLFDEAAHDNLFGRHPGRPEPLGSWLLTVMRTAGYEPHVYVSTNLTYARTRDRLLGPEPRTLDFFQAASDEGDDPSDKNTNDRVAVDRMVELIGKTRWNGRPQFLLLQLDSTHYTYPFPEDHAVFTPFSESLTLPRPIENEREARLLQNRYRNAAHYVDAQLKRVIDALKQAGVYDDTAIVLTADHGEGLSPGLQGHAAVFETTRHVPLLMKFPGQAPGRTRQLISHRDILPTLTEYLGISMPSGSTRGRPASQGPVPGVLTVAPSGRFGQVVTADGATDLRLLYKPTTVIVTPDAGTASANVWMPQLKWFLQGSGR